MSQKINKLTSARRPATGVRRFNNNRRNAILRYRNNNRGFARMPAAFTSSYSANSRIEQVNGVPCLISQEVFPIYANSSNPLIFSLEAVPTKWQGTRSAVLASTYTGFRPIQVNLIYQPSVGTSSQGNIAIGTVFDGASTNLSSASSAMTSLPATNGGFICQLYRPMKSRVRLSTSLRYNLFPTYNVDPDDIPFWIAVSAQTSLENGTQIGNLIVQFKATLHNPAISPANPTSANNVNLTFVHTPASGDTQASTIMQMAKSAVKNALTLGRDYYFNFNSPVLNTTGGEVLRTLQQVPLSCFNITDTNYEFPFDNNVASASLIGNLIGPSSTGNFWQ